MAGIKIRDLRSDLGFGSIVEGADFENLKDPVVRKQLNEVFEDRGLIVFEGVDNSTPQMMLAVSDVFGQLKEHPTATTPRAVDKDTAPGVIDMHTKPRPDDGNYAGLVEIDGKKLANFSPWHFDHCYNDELNRAGVLRALLNAPEGGRTGFADGIELYKDFSPELRAKIEGLNIIYTLDVRLTKMRFGRTFNTFGDTPILLKVAEEARTFPRAMHPAVWTRKDGSKVLHVGPWMSVGIEHHEDPEGEALFEEVCQEVNRKANAKSYWHDWKPSDMLIWDNWRLLHAVEGCDPQYERRTQRTTIKGDYGLGFFEDGKKIGEVMREIA